MAGAARSRKGQSRPNARGQTVVVEWRSGWVKKNWAQFKGGTGAIRVNSVQWKSTV